MESTANITVQIGRDQIMDGIRKLLLTTPNPRVGCWSISDAEELEAAARLLRREIGADLKPSVCTLTIQFDGGCSPNPGAKYGSYEVREHGSVVKSANRVQFGHGTNNEAELEALAEGLKAAYEYLDEKKARHADYQLMILTDSKLVGHRMKWKPNRNPGNPRMALRASLCLELAKKFAGFKVEWLPRSHNVATFGH